MKLIKAKIEVIHPDATSTHWIGYPKVWIDNKEKIPAMLDPGDRLEEVIENGKIYKIVYALCHDDIFQALIAVEGIVPATAEEARIYSETKYPRKIVTTDQDALNSILVKIAKSLPLTDAEKESIDPEHPRKGVQFSKNWIDIIQESHGNIT